MQFRWRAGRRFRIARRTEVPDDRSHLRGRGYASTRFDPRNHGGVAFTDGAAGVARRRAVGLDAGTPALGAHPERGGVTRRRMAAALHGAGWRGRRLVRAAG